jgi:hypothetical protein
MKYIRFVNKSVINIDSCQDQGVFCEAFALRDNGSLSEEEKELARLLDWFDANLETPTKFARVKKPLHRAKKVAICWFKETATKHIVKIKGFLDLLSHHGAVVSQIETRKPGYITYEDEFQVAAMPFRGV